MVLHLCVENGVSGKQKKGAHHFPW